MGVENNREHGEQRERKSKKPYISKVFGIPAFQIVVGTIGNKLKKRMCIMERKLYLELCQQQATKGCVLVEYGGIAYHPYAYELKFQQDGKIKHTAILKEPKANCLVYCRLEDVKEK